MKSLVAISLILICSKALSATLADVSKLANQNQVPLALTTLENIKIAKDLKDMTRARLYFQVGSLDKAITEYKKVPKASEYWFEAQEEQAHTMGRKGEYAKAIGQLETVMVEPFYHLTGPEPYFVTAMTFLKICNFADTLKTTKQFKERFIPRVATLKSIAKGDKTEALMQIQEKLQTQKMSLDVAGKHIAHVPRFLHRDAQIKQNPGLLFKRAQVLARNEISEINDVVAKLQLIEAEVVHRLHLATRDNDRPTQGEVPTGSDVMTFPKNDDEVWLDEVGNYNAQVEVCPSPRKRVSL